MKYAAPAARGWRGGFGRRWQRLIVLAAVLAAASLLLQPYLFFAIYWEMPFALALGLVGYLPRRRLGDALFLALPAGAATMVEPGVAPQAFACVALPVFVLTRRPRFAATLAVGLMAVLLVGIHLKSRFAGTRLTWHDIRFFFLQFQDNIGVVSSQPTVAGFGAVAIAVLALLLVGSWVWDSRVVGRGAMGPRWLPPAASLGLALWSGFVVAGEAEHARNRGAWRLGETPDWRAVPISGFVATAAVSPAWMPPPSDTTRFRQAARERIGGGAAGGTLPDVLLFLQESQMNPAAIGGCPPDLCRLPLFERAAQTRAAGALRVHVVSSGTWLSEFAVATGVPHDVFGPAGDFAPFNVAPGVRQSFVRSMRQAGYHTVAIYPVRGGMMNARQAYEGYGFAKFYDAQALGLSGSFFTPDDDMHEAAVRVLEQERQQGKPVMLFVITIFNHGEHGVRMHRVPPALVQQASGAFGPGPDAENVADYVWRTLEFQRVMSATRRKVLGGRPAVLAWYGDHQPPFGTAPALVAKIGPLAPGVPARFQTWYEISSNRPAPAVPPRSDGPLDIAFLPGLIAQHAGVPLDDWLAANVTARELCGGLFYECRDPQVRAGYLSHVRQDLQAFQLP